MGGEVRALLEPEPQQPVRVLVAATLPGRVRVAEVEPRVKRGLDLCVLGELGSRSQVTERRRCSGSLPISRTIAVATVSAVWSPGRCSRIVNRVVRSTSVPIAVPSQPMIKSPSLRCCGG